MKPLTNTEQSYHFYIKTSRPVLREELRGLSHKAGTTNPSENNTEAIVIKYMKQYVTAYLKNLMPYKLIKQNRF